MSSIGPSPLTASAEVEVTFPDGSLGVDGLTPAAQSKIQDLVGKYVADLVDEAARLEAGDRRDGLIPEITASHVTSADEVVRRPIKIDVGQPSNWRDKLALIVATISGAIAGVLGGYLTLGWGQALAFGICATVSLVAVVFGILRSR